MSRPRLLPRLRLAFPGRLDNRADDLVRILGVWRSLFVTKVDLAVLTNGCRAQMRAAEICGKDAARVRILAFNGLLPESVILAFDSKPRGDDF